MTKQQIRVSLAESIIKGQKRSEHPDTIISMSDALGIVDALVASDDAPEWGMIKVGRETFHRVVAG